jgi:hypothetical protein
MRKLAAFCIGQQTIDASRDVTQVESDRGQICWTCGQLQVRQRAAPFPQILAGKFQGVENCARYRSNFHQRAA